LTRQKIGETEEFSSLDEWAAWLAEKHASATEIWLRLAKKSAGAVTVSRTEASEPRHPSTGSTLAAAEFVGVLERGERVY
jgi:hypothetical protein